MFCEIYFLQDSKYLFAASKPLLVPTCPAIINSTSSLLSFKILKAFISSNTPFSLQMRPENNILKPVAVGSLFIGATAWSTPLAIL